MPLVLLFLGLLACVSITSQPAAAWEFTDRGDGTTFDQGLAVAVRGNVFAAGRINDDIYAVKLNRQRGGAMWRYQPSNAVPGSEMGRAVTFDLNGHPIVAGVTSEDDPVNRARFTVVKIDKDSGVTHWVARIRAGEAFSVVVDWAGDVIAAGILDGGMGVVKLRGTDGVELWRSQPRGDENGGQARSVQVDGAGDVVVGGFLVRSAPSRPDFSVVKLSGVDGTEQWRYQNPSHEFSGGDQALGVAINSSGDVLAVGTIRVFIDNSLPSKFVVVKLGGLAGNLLWRRDIDGGTGTSSGDGFALTIDRVGDVIATGGIDAESAVVKLSGTDGNEQWRHVMSERPRPGRSIDVDRIGNVVTVGRNMVRKLSGSTGAELWPAENTTLPSVQTARGVVFDDVGDVVVVGDGESGAVVVKLKGDDGASF